jgi:hypothetical protein
VNVKVAAKGKVVEVWFTQDQAADSYERVDRHDVREAIAAIVSELDAS